MRDSPMQMYKWNASKSAQYQLTELELPSKPVCQKQPPAKTVWQQMVNNITSFTSSIKQLGHRQNLISIVLLSLVWASLGFSFFSLGEWVPRTVQKLKEEEYNSQTNVTRDSAKTGELFVTKLENSHFINVTFDSCGFLHVTLSHVIFERCFFENVDFSNVMSSKTFFINSTVENSRFVDTDLTEDRFKDCELVNNTIMSINGQCRTDVDFNLSMSYLIRENLIRLCQPLIAIALGALCLTKVKRSTIGVCSMLGCSLGSLATWLLHSTLSLWLFDSIWSFVFVFAFNAANVITTESFPVHLRSTGFGLSLAWARLGGVLGWGWGGPPGLPAASALLVGGVALFSLPDSSGQLL